MVVIDNPDFIIMRYLKQSNKNKLEYKTLNEIKRLLDVEFPDVYVYIHRQAVENIVYEFSDYFAIKDNSIIVIRKIPKNMNINIPYMDDCKKPITSQKLNKIFKLVNQ